VRNVLSISTEITEITKVGTGEDKHQSFRGDTGNTGVRIVQRISTQIRANMPREKRVPCAELFDVCTLRTDTPVLCSEPRVPRVPVEFLEILVCLSSVSDLDGLRDLRGDTPERHP